MAVVSVKVFCYLVNSAALPRKDIHALKPLDLRKFFQQRFGILEVSGVKALGEPAINLRQKLVRLYALALLLPQPTQARRGAQLQRFRLLAAGYGEGLVKTSFSLRVVVGRQR